MRPLCLVWIVFMLSAAVSTGQQKHGDATPPVLSLNDSSVVKELQKSRGSILLVNVWATWCVPCVKEFPDLLKLRNSFADRGLDVVLISVDDPRKLRRDVHPFLKKMKVTFPTYIKQTRNDEAFMNALSPEWRGALPATFVFDRTGKLVQTCVDAISYAELASVLELLLTQ